MESDAEHEAVELRRARDRSLHLKAASGRGLVRREHCEQTIASELVDYTAMVTNQRNQAAKDIMKALMRRRGSVDLCHRSEAAQVTEQHRHVGLSRDQYGFRILAGESFSRSIWASVSP